MFIRKIFILIVSFAPAFSQPATSENTIYHLLNINDDGFLAGTFQATEHPALVSAPENTQLSVRYDYEDLYRELGLFSVNKNRFVVDYRQPLRSLSPSSLFSLHLARERLRINHSDQAGVLPDINLSGEFSYAGNRNKVGFSLGFQHMGHSNRLTIDHYQGSEDDWLLNRYFYDLLQPTFGNRIDLTMNINRFAFTGEYLHAIGDRVEVGTKLSFMQLKNQANLSYFNSTEKLAGEKVISTPFANRNYSLQILALTAIRKTQLRFFLSLDRSRYTLELNPENPSKSGDIYIDYTDLGNCSLNRTGYGFGLGVTYPVTTGLQLTISNAFAWDSWRGEGTVYTPVLGFEILPIAHYFEGTISAATTTNHLQLNLKHQPWQRFLYHFQLGWLAAKLKPQWQGTAYMEFGIDNQNFDDHKQYTGNIFVLKLCPTVKLFQNWTMGYALSQWIPLFKEKDKPPVPALQPQPPLESLSPKSRSAGGRIHQLIITYNF
jgi:hypothetical protein